MTSADYAEFRFRCNYDPSHPLFSFRQAMAAVFMLGVRATDCHFWFPLVREWPMEGAAEMADAMEDIAKAFKPS